MYLAVRFRILVVVGCDSGRTDPNVVIIGNGDDYPSLFGERITFPYWIPITLGTKTTFGDISVIISTTRWYDDTEIDKKDPSYPKECAEGGAIIIRTCDDTFIRLDKNGLVLSDKGKEHDLNDIVKRLEKLEDVISKVIIPSTDT